MIDKIKSIKPLNLPNLKPIKTDSVYKKGGQTLKEWSMAGGGVPREYKGREHVWHKKAKKFAEGGEVSMAKGGAAFGVFPQMKGKRSKQDPEAAKNFPVDLARGVLAGVIGMPGDIESLARLPYELISGNDSPTFLPTSEDMLKRIPFGSDSPVGEFASGLGALAGGSANLGAIPRAVKAAPGALKAGVRNLSTPRTMSPQAGAIVYHGTPHKFAPTEKNPLGEFNRKKIGSGEGNQAYGYGHYVAEARGVAEEYAKNLANRDMANQGRLNAHANAKRLAELAGDPKYAADDVRFVLEINPDHPQKELLQKTLGFLESGAYAKPLKTAGNLYEIDLPDEKIARMLDFDKPLSEQSESVRQAIKEYELDYVPENLSGGRLIEEMNKAFTPDMVATHMRSAGIPGIRYLDEQSRGATGMGRYKIKLPSGEEQIYNFKPDDDALKLMNATIEPYGTQNFVVFPGEEDALNIIDRKKEGGSVHFSDNPDVMQLDLATGGIVRGLKSVIGKAAEAAGMKAPVTANKDLTTMQDFHTSLGDRVRQGAVETQNMIESMPFKYDKGQRVFTDDSSKKNKAPYTILQRTRYGNQVMYDTEGGGMKARKDPDTGKALRTPYEPGYKVRQGDGDDYSEFIIPESAIRGDVEMAAAGAVKDALKKLLKKEKVDHPLVFPRAEPKSIEQIRPIAQRMAEQMTGDFVRQNPKLTTNPAGKSRKQFEREQSIPLVTRNVVPEIDVPPINYENFIDYAMVGVPGDASLGGVAKRGSLTENTKPTVELTQVGDITPDQPVPLFGGPRFGNDETFWASNADAATPVQNNVNALSELYDAPVLGQYIKMASDSANFALHNLDSLLAIQRPERLDQSKMEQLNELIRKGSLKYGKFPGFKGFDDPIDVLLQSQLNSKLRKHIAETLTKPTITDAFGLPNGLDVVAAITHPQLRNLETGVSGFSVGQMTPGATLRRGESAHPTYDTDITGKLIFQNKYPTPYEIAFPDTTAYARSQLAPGVQEFNMMKLLGPREKVDQQYIDEMKMYEELMKQYTGKKKGGAVGGLSTVNKLCGSHK